jgi:hypothetical protein
MEAGAAFARNIRRVWPMHVPSKNKFADYPLSALQVNGHLEAKSWMRPAIVIPSTAAIAGRSTSA